MWRDQASVRLCENPLPWLGQEHGAPDHAVCAIESVDDAPTIVGCCVRSACIRANNQGFILVIQQQARGNRAFLHPQATHIRLMSNLFVVSLEETEYGRRGMNRFDPHVGPPRNLSTVRYLFPTAPGEPIRFSVPVPTSGAVPCSNVINPPGDQRRQSLQPFSSTVLTLRPGQ